MSAGEVVPPPTAPADVVIHSHVGPVSRVTPVHTAMRNCTRDEIRSFEVGNQVLISNHRKLLWSKARVVNDSGRYDWERRAQANRFGSVEILAWGSPETAQAASGM